MNPIFWQAGFQADQTESHLSRNLLHCMEIEYFINANAKRGGKPKGKFQRREIFARFQGDDRLARDSNFLSQSLLRHFIVIEPKAADLI